MSKRILAFLLLATQFQAQTAHYYVNFQSGNDSNTGTSVAQAWKRSPGDPNASGTAASTTLQPGDTVQLISTYVGSITVPRSGTPGNPITWLLRNTNGARTQVTRSNDTLGSVANKVFGFSLQQRSNIVIRGGEFHNIGGWPYNHSIFSGPAYSIVGGEDIPIFNDGPIALGIWAVNCRDLWVEDVRFREMGHWTNVVQNFSHNVINGHGIFFNGGTNIVLTNFYATRVGIAVRVSPLPAVKNVLVTDGLIESHIRWGIDVSSTIANTAISDITMRRVWIRDYHEYDEQAWKGGKNANLGQDNPHTDGIFVRATRSGVSFTNILVDSCIFSSDNVAGNTVGGTAHVYFQGGGSGAVINSIFSRTLHYQSIFVSGTVQDPGKCEVRIMNNTFWNAQRPLRIHDASSPIPDNKRHIYFINNIVSSTNTTGEIEAISLREARLTNQITAYNNAYWYPFESTATAPIFQIDGGSQLNLSQFKAIGKDQNSVYGDVAFSNAVIGVNTSNLNFRLKDVSVARNIGTNLSSIFTYDADGNTREVWDAGAFAFDGTPPDPDDETPPEPDPPVWENVPFATSAHSITMSWDPCVDDSGGIVTYTVIASGGTGCEGITTITETFFTNDGIAASTTCGYRVIACDESGNCTDASTEEFATTDQVPPPQLLVTGSAAIQTGRVAGIQVPDYWLSHATKTTMVAISANRRINPNYQGALFRVKRASDDEETDITTASGSINYDTNALLAFVAGTDAWLIRYYDQSGNANNPFPSSIERRPYIARGGNLLTTTNGHLGVWFSVSNRLMTPAITLNPPFTQVGMFHLLSRTTNGILFGGNSTARATFREGTNNLTMFSGVPPLVTPEVATNQLYGAYMLISTNEANNYIRLNGAVVASNGGGTNPFSATQARLGGDGTGGTGKSANMLLVGEYALFDGELSPEELEALEANQRAYYGHY